MSNVTRKLLYVLAVCIVIVAAVSVAALRLRPPRTFQIMSMDGYGGDAGFSGKGLGCSMQTWKSSDGIEIFEASVSYANADDARKDFDDELKTATTIHERVDRPNYRRAIATFTTSNFSCFSCEVKLITLEDKEIRFIEASSLDSVTAFDRFDRSWSKYF